MAVVPYFVAVEPDLKLEVEVDVLAEVSNPHQPLADMFEDPLQHLDECDFDRVVAAESDDTATHRLRMCVEDYPDGIAIRNKMGYPYYAPQSDVHVDGYSWRGEVDDEADAPLLADSTTTTAATTWIQLEMHGDECAICLRRYASKSKLWRHLRLVHGPRVWHLCHICGKSLASRSSLRAHMYLHSEKPFRCPECGAGFVRRPQLRVHLDAKHGGGVVDPRGGARVVRVLHPQLASADTGGVVFVQDDVDYRASASTLEADPTMTTTLPPTPSPSSSTSSSSVAGHDRGEAIVLRLVRDVDPGMWKVANLGKL